MTLVLAPLSPAEVKRRVNENTAVLIDIREPDEYVRRHIPGAQSLPLSGLSAAHADLDSGRDIIFTCRSGMRTAGACDRLAARVSGEAFVLEGGVDAWAAAGLPVTVDEKAPLEIMRQVQIAAGSLILIGVILGFLVSPLWFGLAGFVGAGLTFAGVTGFCGMARLLMMAPWNRAPVATA